MLRFFEGIASFIVINFEGVMITCKEKIFSEVCFSINVKIVGNVQAICACNPSEYFGISKIFVHFGKIRKEMAN